MASIIPGYEYDIFISYRQKDNKHDGWVSEFVDNLKGELESIFKEEISVYFDINPHDGLLETHDVDASLKEKLKCLIFVPILSQTYCDSKSFAWQHEFCAFNKHAKEDKFGRDIRLAGGNVASRILPVKIHDLDPEDKTLLENELGGVLRCIEFIYKSAGVNRPLRTSEDHPHDNLNKTFYRDQINKVANAVKEIITAIKKYNSQDEEVSTQVVKAKPEKLKNLKSRFIIASFLVLALIALGYFFIPKLFIPSKPVEKSIAVLPFANLGSDEDKAWFNDGMTDVVINQLSKISGLRVLGWTSTQKYKEGNKSISEIGKELGINYIIEGTVQRHGDKMRISVQLIRVFNENHIWSNIYDRDWKDIFYVQSEIAKRIVEELETVLTPNEKEQIEKSETQNPGAYNLYLQGRFFIAKRTEEGINRSIEYFEKSIKEDPEYALPYTGIADAYWLRSWHGWAPKKEGFEKAKEFASKAIKIDNNLAEAHSTLGVILLWSEWKWEEARDELKRATELNQKYANGHFYYSLLLDIVKQNEEARSQINKAIELDPFFPTMHWVSSLFYYHVGKFNESLNECLKAYELNPDIGAYWTDQYNWMFFNLYIKLGHDLKAIEALQNVTIINSLNSGNSNFLLEKYNKEGINGIINWLINSQQKNVDPITLARWNAKLNRKDEALKLLETGFEESVVEIPRINNDLDFESLRSEPRFQALIKKMGLSTNITIE
ncbi:MAG: hypothetical protein MUO72_11030 [Bacteroidales bacterium]|nr:hypothetical protein [Bacteroidales bacterium]